VKLPAEVIDPYGELYDYGSAMHYSRMAFSSDDQHPTIYPIVRLFKPTQFLVSLLQLQNPLNAEIGQRIELSEVDVKKLMRMYNCPGI